MKKLLVMLLLFISMHSVYGEILNTEGTISTVRYHTVLHNTTDARQLTSFSMNIPFNTGCSWVYLVAGDKEALSTVLAAKMSNATVKIYYDSQQLYRGLCAVTAIDIL
ncbi:MAG: hypothetical protein AAGB12_06145 [Pseudomonadota bacterium]